MKHLKISLKLLVLLMAIGFMVAGCQKEDDNLTEHITGKNTGDVNAKLINLDELKQVQALRPHLNAIEGTFDIHKAKTGAQSKIVASDSSFTILTDEILQVTTSYSEAYTFRIETPSHPYADFENFVIQKDNNKTYQFYIYSYITLALNGITDHYIFSAIEVDGDLINTTNFQDLLGAKMQMIGGCLYNVDEVTGNAEPIWCFGTDGGTDGGDGGDGGDDGGYQDGDIISIIPNGDGTCTITTAGTGPLGNPVKFVDRYADCPNGMDNGNPDGDDNDNNWDDDTHLNDNPPIEPGGSGTGNGNSNPTPIGTLPSINYAELAEMCLGFAGTSTSCISFGNKKALGMYIKDNSCDAFAQEAGEALCEGAVVDWEENIIYDPSLMDFPCHKMVIEDAIGVCSPLTQAVLDAFEANDGTNLILKISNSIASNANTSVLPQYNPITHTCNITINFRESYVEATTDLSLARTAIHESLHAILVYMFEEGQLVDQNGMPIVGFENLVIAYMNFLSGLPENMNISHHTLMSDFVDDIATSLSAYGVSQGYDYPFSYYKKLSWGGLMGTPTFEALYPQYLDPDDEISNPDNVNPQWLDILYILLAEQDNSELTFNHPNGTIYEFTPKGTQPNETEPCN